MRQENIRTKYGYGTRTAWSDLRDACFVCLIGQAFSGKPFVCAIPYALRLLILTTPADSDWGRSTSTIKYSAAVPDDVLTIRTAIKEAEAAICLLEQELLLEFALEDEIAESEIADSEIADSDYSGEVRTRVGKATVKKEGKELGNWDKKDGSEATTPAVPSTNDEATDREDDLAARADYEEWAPPPRSVPICGDVRDVDFERLALAQQKARGSLFDVIMMDPPWQLASSNPTRGVAIGYSQLADWHIQNLPVRQLQQNGFIFMW